VRLRRAGDATGSGRGPSAPSSAFVGQLTRSTSLYGLWRGERSVASVYSREREVTVVCRLMSPSWSVIRSSGG
jgi:hypothetical protein